MYNFEGNLKTTVNAKSVSFEKYEGGALPDADCIAVTYGDEYFPDDD